MYGVQSCNGQIREGTHIHSLYRRLRFSTTGFTITVEQLINSRRRKYKKKKGIYNSYIASTNQQSLHPAWKLGRSRLVASHSARRWRGRMLQGSFGFCSCGSCPPAPLHRNTKFVSLHQAIVESKTTLTVAVECRGGICLCELAL
jgi:hypothetical protein